MFALYSSVYVFFFSIGSEIDENLKVKNKRKGRKREGVNPTGANSTLSIVLKVLNFVMVKYYVM